jgi:Biotin-requiring enzyme
MKVMQEMIIPKESVNDDNALIAKLNFRDGDAVKSGDVVLVCETSKTIFELRTSQSGYIFYKCKEGDLMDVGSVVAVVYDEKSGTVGQNESGIGKATRDMTQEKKTIFSKKAKSLLDENHLNESEFAGKDLVGVDDVVAFLNEKKARQELAPKKMAVNKDVMNSSVKSPAKTNNWYDNERIVVICANAISAEVIDDVLDGQNDKKIVGYVIDDAFKAGSGLKLLDSNVFDFPQRVDRKTYDTVIIAMGGSLKSMQFRKKVFDHYVASGINFTNIISKRAIIGRNVSIGAGNIIEAGVFIGTGSVIGDNNFVSYMATIGHHNRIGSHNLFAPGVMMSGLVEVGDECILPTGVNFIDKVKIGNKVILPIGYNVISNIEDGTVIKMRG